MTGTEIIISIISAASVLAGILISEWLACIRERRQANKIRKLLELEIGANLSLLQGICSELSNKRETLSRETFPDQDQNTEEGHLSVKSQLGNALARHLIKLPVPNWRRNAWESQIYLLSVSLKDSQLEVIHRLYCTLDELSDIRQKIIQLSTSKGDPGDPGLRHLFGGATVEEMAFFWCEFEKRMTQLLSAGNPLAPKRSKRFPSFFKRRSPKLPDQVAKTTLE